MRIACQILIIASMAIKTLIWVFGLALQKKTHSDRVNALLSSVFIMVLTALVLYGAGAFSELF